MAADDLLARLDILVGSEPNHVAVVADEAATAIRRLRAALVEARAATTHATTQRDALRSVVRRYARGWVIDTYDDGVDHWHDPHTGTREALSRAEAVARRAALDVPAADTATPHDSFGLNIVKPAADTATEDQS